MRTASRSASSSALPAFFSPEVAAARRFYSDLNPSTRRRLVVMCGGLEHCTPDYAIHRASFPYFSIEYVARGTGALKLKGQAIALRPGTLFAYGPGVAQDITGNRTDPLVKYFVDFAGTDAGVLVRRCRLELLRNGCPRLHDDPRRRVGPLVARRLEARAWRARLTRRIARFGR